MGSRTFHALCNEAGIAAEHLAIGATALGRANYAQQAYYGQAFFALSVGIERSSKLAIVSDHALVHNGQFPDATTLRAYGHDLRRLLNEVVNIVKRRELEGHDLPNSPIHESVIGILADFARNVTRYYNFEVVTDTVAKAPNPVAAWTERVTIPVVDAHVSERQINNIADRAGQVGDLLEGKALIRHTSETGANIRSASEASFRTGLREAARSWEQLYVLQIARFLGSALDGLAFEAQQERIADIPYYGEFYAIFMNDDHYLRSRRTWSIYRR